jgi:hypothetical protein
VVVGDSVVGTSVGAFDGEALGKFVGTSVGTGAELDGAAVRGDLPRAYTCPSSDPKYTTPSKPTAGEEIILPPVLYL